MGRPGVEAHGVNLPPLMPTSRLVQVQDPAVPLLIQLPINMPDKTADEGRSVWAPPTHGEDLAQTSDESKNIHICFSFHNLIMGS